MLTNVTRARSTFVGRARPLADLRRHLAEGAQIVTVVGAPGVGKSRLALRLVEERLSEYASYGGAWVCDLVNATTDRHVHRAMAHALSIGPDADDDLARLGYSLASRGPTLIVLDDAERVVGAVGAAVVRLAELAPESVFIVTSRERLGIEGEVVVDVGPLDVGEAGSQSATSSEAVELFLDRARSVVPDFAPDDDELAAIATLVVRLDGLPLAIELAASRVEVAPPATLLHRLEDRFALLARAGGEESRHRTLYTAIDASWSLLDANEQAMLAQTALFAGPFSLEAAEAILEPGASAPASIDLLQGLCKKSLVCVAPAGDGGPRRFSLSASVRDFALEKLNASPAAPRARRRHARYFAGRASPRVDDLGDLTAAFAHLTEGPGDAGRAADVLDAALAIGQIAMRAGPLSLAVTHLSKALDTRGVERLDAGPRVRALIALARARVLSGDPGGADAELRRARALAADSDDRARADVAAAVGWHAFKVSDLEAARDAYEEGRRLAGSVGDERRVGRIEDGLGTVWMDLGDIDRARTCFESALRACRSAGDQAGEATALAHLAAVNLEHGRLDRARTQFEKAIAELQRLGDERAASVHLGSLGLVLLEAGEEKLAAQRVEQALDAHRKLGQRQHEGFALSYQAMVLEAGGRWAEALDVCEEAVRVLAQTGNTLWEARLLCIQARLEANEGSLLSSAGTHARAVERLRRLDDDVGLRVARLAEGHLELARARAAAGEGDAAAEHQKRAEAVLAEERRRSDVGHGDVRWATLQLGRALDRERRPPADAVATLTVGERGDWFETSTGARAVLESRAALRNLLASLVEQHATAPGSSLSREDLYRAAWPGDRAHPEAASNRLHVALSTLRKLGLRGILRRSAEGYYLDPAVRVVVSGRS